MTASLSDFEVCFNGKTFLTVDKGQLNVQGIDFQTDLVNISRLMSILSDVLDTALTAQAKPPETNNVYSLQEARALKA